MPRTCLACASPNREAIDTALANGTPLRNISERFGMAAASLCRHKSHVASAIVKAQEQREENIGDNVLDEMGRLRRKAWQLLGKMEKQKDHRGAIVAVRELRECWQSFDAMLEKAKVQGHTGMRIIVEHVGSGGKPYLMEQGKPLETGTNFFRTTDPQPQLPAPALPAPVEQAASAAKPNETDVTSKNGNGVPKPTKADIQAWRAQGTAIPYRGTEERGQVNITPNVATPRRVVGFGRRLRGARRP